MLVGPTVSIPVLCANACAPEATSVLSSRCHGVRYQSRVKIIHFVSIRQGTWDAQGTDAAKSVGHAGVREYSVRKLDRVSNPCCVLRMEAYPERNVDDQAAATHVRVTVISGCV